MIKTLGIYKFFGVNVYNLCLKHFIYFELALCWFLSSLPMIWLTRLSKMYRWSHLNLQCHSCSVEQCNDAKQIELRQKCIMEWRIYLIFCPVYDFSFGSAVSSLHQKGHCNIAKHDFCMWLTYQSLTTMSKVDFTLLCMTQKKWRIHLYKPRMKILNI